MGPFLQIIPQTIASIDTSLLHLEFSVMSVASATLPLTPFSLLFLFVSLLAKQFLNHGYF